MRPPRESFGALKKRRVRGWSGSFLFPPPFLLFFFAHFLFLSVLTNERWGGKEKGEKGEKIRASEETVLLPSPLLFLFFFRTSGTFFSISIQFSHLPLAELALAPLLPIWASTLFLFALPQSPKPYSALGAESQMKMNALMFGPSFSLSLYLLFAPERPRRSATATHDGKKENGPRSPFYYNPLFDPRP